MFWKETILSVNLPQQLEQAESKINNSLIMKKVKKLTNFEQICHLLGAAHWGAPQYFKISI